jgi:uncharacterized membrane protein YqjE
LAYDSAPLDDEPAPGPVSGLFKSLANLVATAIAIAQTRVELLTTELQEEVHRAAELLVWTLVALLAAAMGLFLTALVIIFVFWDTHRVLASVAVASAFFVLAAAALLTLRAKVRHRPKLLEGTFAELAKDREHLKDAALKARPR